MNVAVLSHSLIIPVVNLAVEHPYSVATRRHIGFGDLAHAEGERSRTSSHIANTDDDVARCRERDEVNFFESLVN